MENSVSRSTVEAIIVIGVFALFAAWISGSYQGRDEEEKAWRKLLYRAELPETCTRKIREASEQLNFEAEQRQQKE